MSSNDNQNWPYPGSPGAGTPPGAPGSGPDPTQAIPTQSGWPAASGGTAPESATPSGWGTPQASSGWGSGTTQPIPTQGGWGGGETQQFPVAGSAAGAYGQQSQGSWGAAPQSGYGQQGSNPPPGGYGGQPGYGSYGEPPQKKNGLVWWIIGGVVLLAGIVVGILFLTGVLGGGDEPDDAATSPVSTAPIAPTVAPTTPAADPAPVVGNGPPGTDPELDALWTSCAGGDMAACDELYWNSGVGTPYEDFAKTCGGITDSAAGLCEIEFGDPGTTTTPSAYGDDATLDALWDGCSGGSMVDCDDLYWLSGVGTEYENYGATCGNTQEWSAGSCEIADGTDNPASEPGSGAPGTDASLDALWTSCSEGDMAACDELYWNAPSGSDYETYGGSCGGTQPDDYGFWCHPDSSNLYGTG